MPRIRVAAAQRNLVVGDLDGNEARILEAYDRAAAVDTDLVAFPELAITGYPPEDLLLRPAFVAHAAESLAKIAARTGSTAAIVGYPELLADGGLSNSAALCAQGEVRGALCLSETEAGSDLQSLRTTATRDGEVYRINGSKMWITNARHAQLFLVLTKTDTSVKPAHRGISAFVAQKGQPGLTVGRDIPKLGYRGLETCEVHFENFAVPAANLIGGVEGQGFAQVMTGFEAERLNLAARALGLARAAFEDAIAYAQQRVTFGKPIAEHQAIQLKLADMATRIEATRLLTYSAAEKKDRGERCDLEVAMAKVFASETAVETSLEAMKILGGNGYSKDFPVERYYRDAPLTLIGGGTGEIVRLLIARRLLAKYAAPA